MKHSPTPDVPLRQYCQSVGKLESTLGKFECLENTIRMDSVQCRTKSHTYILMLSLPEEELAERISSSRVSLIGFESSFNHSRTHQKLLSTFNLWPFLVFTRVYGVQAKKQLRGP